MELTNIINHIQAQCPSANQVVAADGIVRDTIDTSKIVYDLVKDTVSNRAYPSILPEQVILPALVYEQVESSPSAIENIDILQTDTQVISFLTQTYAELVTLRKSIRNALIAYTQTDETGVIEITNESVRYVKDVKLKSFICSMQLNINHLLGANQCIPAILVYERSTAGESEVTPNNKQNVSTQLGFIIIAKNDQVSTIRDELFTALLPYQDTPYHFSTAHVSGKRIDSTGQLVIWKDDYQTELQKA